MFGPELVDPNVEINFDYELNGYRKNFIKNISILLGFFICSFHNRERHLVTHTKREVISMILHT